MLGQIQVTYFDKEKGPLNRVRRKDIVGDDNVEMADKMVYKSMRSTTSYSRLEIPLSQSKFKLIRLNNGRRGQVGELIRDKEVMADVADILGDMDNRLPFKNNVEYEWARFKQSSKMTKESMTMFFSNPTLAPMWEHLSYKNVDEMRALLTELLYDKVTW